MIKLKLYYVGVAGSHLVLEHSFENNTPLHLKNILPQLKTALSNHIVHDFACNKIRLKTSEKTVIPILSENLINNLEEDTINIFYLEIITPQASAHIDELKLKNNAIVTIDIFSREDNHRFSPHVTVSYGSESIRILLTPTVMIMDNLHFHGNRRKYEKEILIYVQKKRNYYLHEWEKFVESRFK